MSRCTCLLVLLALAGFVACGDGGPESPTLHVRTFEVDGPPPAALRATRVGPAGQAESYPLKPAGGDDPTLYVVEGAPRGAYVIDGDGGWSMLTTGKAVPLDPGASPTAVQLGHPHTLYLVATRSGLRPSTRWGAQVVTRGVASPSAIDVKVLREPPHGYTVALRFLPDAWEGELQAVGYLIDGPPGVSPDLETLGNLAEPVRFRARTGGRPVLGPVRAAPTAPLTVVLVPGGADTVVDDLLVRVDLVGTPLLARYEDRARDGVARFDAIADLGNHLRISIAGREESFSLEQRTWQDLRDMYILALGEEATRKVRIKLPGDRDATSLDHVMARPAGAPAFGLVAFAEGPEDEVTFSIPRSSTVVFLRSERDWARLALPKGTDDLEGVEGITFEAGVTVQGSVRGDVRGATVVLFRQEGGEAVAGNGFVIRAPPSGQFSGLVPPGTYLVEVISPRGTWKKEAPVKAHKPGGQIHLNLRAP